MDEKQKRLIAALIELTTALVILAASDPTSATRARAAAWSVSGRAAGGLARGYGRAGMRLELAGHPDAAKHFYGLAARLARWAIRTPERTRGLA